MKFGLRTSHPLPTQLFHDSVNLVGDFSMKSLRQGAPGSRMRKATGPGEPLNGYISPWIMEIMEVEIFIKHHSKFLLNWKVMGKICYSGNTHPYDQAKKAKERKRLGKPPYWEKGSKRKENTWQERRDIVHLLTFVHPYFLLTVVLDAFNFYSSGSNQRLTASVQLEVYVILVLEYRQVCT